MHVDSDETKTPGKKKRKKLPLNLKFETTPIEQVSKHRLLGVTVDEQLKWETLSQPRREPVWSSGKALGW